MKCQLPFAPSFRGNFHSLRWHFWNCISTTTTTGLMKTGKAQWQQPIKLIIIIIISFCSCCSNCSQQQQQQQWQWQHRKHQKHKSVPLGVILVCQSFPDCSPVRLLVLRPFHFISSTLLYFTLCIWQPLVCFTLLYGSQILVGWQSVAKLNLLAWWF